MVAVGIPHKQDEQSSTYTNDVECGIPVDTSHDDSSSNTHQASSDRSNNPMLYTQTHVRDRCKMHPTTRFLIIGITLFSVLLFSLIYLPQRTGGSLNNRYSSPSHHLIIHHAHFPGRHG